MSTTISADTRGTTATSASAAGRDFGDVVEGLEHREEGRPLPGRYYTDPAVLDADLALVFERQWFLAATEAQIAEPGDYVTIDLGARSIIIVRDDDEQVRAFHNVCRHRGARILTETSGFVGNLVCGYHSWTYSTDGTLRHAPGLPPGTDMACLGLRPVAVRAIAGLVYLCLADEPPADIDDFAKLVEPYLAPHGLATAKVAAVDDLIEQGNWKLVMENNRECYHCDGHPELACTFFLTYGMEPDQVPERLRATFERSLTAESDLRARCTELGLPFELVENLSEPNVAHRVAREALDGAGESFSLTGEAIVSKSLGGLSERKLGRLSIHTQPNAWMHILSDHAIMFSVLPLSADRTLVRSVWLVPADAVEGVDYDLDALMLVWRRTNEQDSTFVGLAQAGVTDPAYVPGPYTETESHLEEFMRWYASRMSEGYRR
ncbi:MAG: aromatic ring-hydroxylating dioxygenase subunit alpha [Dermatophilus congolensis]|nr:aromatic ring-hydroxylating dioxygenase subunit alpha [Dermatophilus congolensis]